MSLVGKNIGRYRITDKLGEGGMAIVYRAEDHSCAARPGLASFPPSGVRSQADLAGLPGIRAIPQTGISAGPNPSVYAFSRSTAQRNL